jgi:glutamyl-tRNA synthetase
MLRVRFAPSPTGYLHVGGARTALFNWLYARRNGGTFVLRIEDTDAERSSWEMVTGIVEGLRWLGLDWDEGPDVGGPYGPYFQSERRARHRAMADRLVHAGRAYYCYCTPDAIQAKRQAAEAAGGGFTYDRTCRTRAPEEVAALEAAGTPRAVRFRVPDGQTTFVDGVRGRIVFENANIEDFVILRSDRQPTYHLSVVADDVEMAISHVIRGDDHISNTPKQILLYEALGHPVPTFAHVPLILGPDRKRLSKRHGATSVTEYQKSGYLPEAMVNFLALLGWSPGDDRELFTRDELVQAFSLDGISGGHAVFNADKLDWMNQRYIMGMPVEALADRLEPVLRAAGLWQDAFAGDRRAWFLRLVALYQPRMRRLVTFPEDARPLLTGDAAIERDQDAEKKHLRKPGLERPVAELRRRLAALPSLDDKAQVEAITREVADVQGVKAAALMQAVRVAVTGRTASPGLFDVLELLGRDRVLARLG